MTKIYEFNKKSRCYSLVIMEGEHCVASFYAHFTKARVLLNLQYTFHGHFFISPTILLRDFINDVDNFIYTGNTNPKDLSNSIFE